MYAELESIGAQRFELCVPVDGMGDFRFEDVPPGRYELRLRSPSSVVYRQPLIVAEAVTYVRAATGEPARPAVPGTVSAAELAHKVPRAAQKEFRKAAGEIAHGRLREAVVHLEKTVRLDPAYARAYNNLGACLGMLKEFGKAEEALRRAVELMPDSAEAHGNLSRALAALSRHPEAESEARRAAGLRARAGLR